MPRPRKVLPELLNHKATGQAYCRWRGKQFYFGQHGSEESRTRFLNFVNSICKSNNVPDADISSELAKLPVRSGDLRVSELVLRFLDFVAAYYVRDGEVTEQIDNYRFSLRHLVKHFGKMCVSDFDSLCLKKLQREGAKNWSRTYTNDVVRRIQRVFRWGNSEKLVPNDVLVNLSSVTALRLGFTEARETEPRQPVSDAKLEATLPHLPKLVADLVQIIRWSGARPSEICRLRFSEIDMTGSVWIYAPKRHKTAHKRKTRIIAFGPKSQEVLRKYLHVDTDEIIFSPRRSEEMRLEALRLRRKSKLTPSQMKRAQNAKRKTFAEKYTKDALARVIKRSCELAFGMPSNLRSIKTTNQKERTALQEQASAWRKLNCWTVYQLRHSAATEIRKTFGIEAAKSVLGHSTLQMTEVYAQADLSATVAVASQIG